MALGGLNMAGVHGSAADDPISQLISLKAKTANGEFRDGMHPHNIGENYESSDDDQDN